MLTSMTGFGSKTGEVTPFGNISVEARSYNHKFLETVVHLPDGFLFLEDKIRKEIETRVKRGRITCVINVSAGKAPAVFINDKLLKNYMAALRNIKRNFHVEGEVSLDTLIHLPGVLSLAESNIPKDKIWPSLKTLLDQAVNKLAVMRRKEGAATAKYLREHAQILKSEITGIQARYKEVCQKKILELRTPEERSSFLKDSDISEEVHRLEYHIKNFMQKLSKAGPVGKELDFIAQEMLRETNTIGAKSCDSMLSARVIQIKSQLEKIREQVQNVE